MSKDTSTIVFSLILLYMFGIFLFLCNSISINIVSLLWLAGEVFVYLLLVGVIAGVHQKAVK